MKLLAFFLTTLPMTIIAQTNEHFSHTESTTANASAIWQIWTDVPNWKQWDSGLKEATLYGDFKEGAKGRLVPDKGPKSKFIISEYREGVGYSFKARIPFGWLIVKRSLTTVENTTSFTHEVMFTGPFRKPIARGAGKRYRKMLPEVMGKIKTLAETKP